jgi:hypothetical protein
MKSPVRTLIKKARRRDLIWRYGFNLVPTLNYALRLRNRLNPEESQVLKALDENGIALSSVESLFGEAGAFAELRSTVAEVMAAKADELERLKAVADDTSSIGQKTFNAELLGSRPVFDHTSIYARIAFHRSLLNIANAYFGMAAKLRYYNVWYNVATTAEARESQLWHRDREDNLILKVFIYLSDVDKESGALSYVAKTHQKGANRNIRPEFFMEDRVQRSTDEQMALAAGKDSWAQACGPRGTIAFVDTRGFHKGGEVRQGERLVYTAMFTSPASDSPRLFEYPTKIKPTEISVQQRSALEAF